MPLTYSSLIQEVQDTLQRYDAQFVSYIPIFINDAIDRINVDAKNIGLEQYVSSVFVPGSNVIQKPARWRRNITFNYGSGADFNTRNTIKLMAYEFLLQYSPDPADATKFGPPVYYSDYGFYNFQVSPTPDLAYPFQLAYLEIPSPLSITVQQNWLTDYAPMLLRYATFVEAAIWSSSNFLNGFQESYQRYLAPFNTQDSLRVIDRSSNRTAD
jgi:hypothetical protein